LRPPIAPIAHYIDAMKRACGNSAPRARVVTADSFRTRIMRRAILALPFSLLLLTPALANAADPPARVGRLSYIDGTVSFHPAGQQGDWSPATVNYPVTSGESFWTDANARTAIEVGPAELRLDQATQLDVSRLDDRSTDLQLDQGVLNLHIAQLPSGQNGMGEISITTPRGRVDIAAPGDYDIDAGQPDNDQPADQIVVSVFDGAAKFESDGGAVDIANGQAAVISGDPLDIQLVAANANDFDQWAEDQEHREDLAKIPQAVPPAVTGYQDLAAYGSWSDDPDYGQVWYPGDVPAGWAPYRYGHWAWVAPWGWTWIDDAPWGFAPFHYGRWIDRDDRWAWVPQDIAPQPVYAPALVSFVGGDGWGVDLTAGAAVAAIGWVALAPHEVYHPQFRASEAFDRRINGRDWNAQAFAARNATLNNFHNRQAATVVPTAAFTHAAPVDRARVTVAADQLARTRASNTAVARLQPSAFARAGRADPQAATVVTPRANAQANVARGRVTANVPAALAQQKAPTAPGPHRVAEAARPNRANAPANAAATPNGNREQRNAAAPTNPARPGSPNATAGANPPANQSGATPNAARGPAPNAEQRAERPNEHQAPAANANLAPHPAPPNQPREAEHAAPNAPNGRATPEQRNLAQHPTPPNAPSREAQHAAPNAPNGRTTPDQRNLAQHPTPPNASSREAERPAPNVPNGRATPEQRNLAQHPTPPNAPSRAAQSQQHAPAAPPPQSAALPHENAPRHAPSPAAPVAHPEAQRSAPPARAAAPPQAPRAPPQEAHAPAPMPPRAAAQAARPAAPAPHPAAAPAPHPPAAPAPAPHPAPAPAPHPAAAPAPHPPAAPAPAPHPAAPAPHPAAAPAAPHPAPAAKAAPQAHPEPEKKDQPH
jgi:hypothetical protein